MLRPRTRRLLLIAALTGASACHKDASAKTSVPVNPDDDAGPDGGDTSAGGNAGKAGKGGTSGSAGSGGHGAAADGGSGAAANGGGGSGGASGDDTDAGNVRDCAASGTMTEWSQPVSFTDPGGFAVTPGLTGFGVAYRAKACGLLGALGVAPVSALAAFQDPQSVFDDCSATLTDISLLHVTDGYRAVWIDNSTGSAELQSLLFGETLVAPSSPTRVRVTNNSVLEMRPEQAMFGGTPYLGWIADDGGKREIDLQAFADGAEVKQLVTMGDGYVPTSLAMAQLAKDHGGVAFVDEAGHRGVWLVPIDDKGQAGAPIQISDAVNGGDTVDLGTRPDDGGGVLYSLALGGVNYEVHFRRLDQSGGFLGDEIKIISSPVQGRDASLAHLGDGYVVAYRQLPSGSDTKASIRLAFITKEGNPMRDSVGRLVTTPLVDTSVSGGRVTARVSVEGELLVGFVDTEAEGGPAFRLVRKRLDCP
jgi:hypothetical protein